MNLLLNNLVLKFLDQKYESETVQYEWNALIIQ